MAKPEILIQLIQFVADDITVLIIVNLIESVDVAVYPIAVVGVCVSIHLEFSPLESAVGKQSIDAVVGRHLPVSAPFHVSHVVVRAGNVVADIYKTFCRPEMFVRHLGVIVSLVCLTPGVIAARFGRIARFHVAASPFASSPAHVDGVRMAVVRTTEFRDAWSQVYFLVGYFNLILAHVNFVAFKKIHIRLVLFKVGTE